MSPVSGFFAAALWFFFAGSVAPTFASAVENSRVQKEATLGQEFELSLGESVLILEESLTVRLLYAGYSTCNRYFLCILPDGPSVTVALSKLRREPKRINFVSFGSIEEYFEYRIRFVTMTGCGSVDPTQSDTCTIRLLVTKI